jgi:hypothetical protein
MHTPQTVEDSLTKKPTWLTEALALIKKHMMKRLVILTSPPWGTNQKSDAARDTALSKSQIEGFANSCAKLDKVTEVVSVQ